jgi:hypothetical protein
MPLQADTLDLLNKLERSSRRGLNYPNEVGQILEAARQGHRTAQFEEAIFLAKFISKSFDVMNRIGTDGDGYDKLSAEFESNTQKLSSLLKEMLISAPDEIRQSQTALFLSLTQESLERLMHLMRDLTAVKNWVVDGNRLPWDLAKE